MNLPKLCLRYFCLVLCFCVTASARAQLKADFSADNLSGCTPLVVQFTDLSTGSPTSYRWDLGNGNTTTVSSPGAIYIDPGTYTIKLVITGAGGIDSVVKQQYITVYGKPNVQFSLSPTTGCKPLPVQFTDHTDPISGTIASWVWDFGDGQISTQQNPLHSYTSSDTFSVTLTTVNSFGCKQTLQNANVVSIYNDVTANFDYNYANACSPPTPVTFNNTSLSKSPLTYQWDLGDGITSQQTNPAHTYTTSGDFTIKLVATSDLGCTDTISKTISVGSVNADFSFNAAVCTNDSVTFTNTSLPAPISVTWSFGDGGTAKTINAVHKYTTAGSYDVLMTANFGTCVFTVTKKITVTNKPKSTFTVTGATASCLIPATITFNGTSTGTTSYKWYFGDGDSSSDQNPSHIYSTQNYYSVTLISFNANGCSDTLTKDSLIHLGPPQITKFNGLPTGGCAPASINFDASIDSPEPITSYSWDFGDGNTSASAKPSHVYNNTGSYNVTLIASTASGCTDTFTLSAAVSVGTKPTAAFTASVTNICASTAVKFINQSTGGSSWQWNYGDGSTFSSVQNPTHFYRDTGKFTITLIASNGGCKDSSRIENYITVNPPVAKFNTSFLCSNKYTRTFTDKSILPKSWAWDFGDGNTTSQQSPSHIYSTPGTYAVKLTVTNGGCTDTQIDTIQVIDMSPTFTYSPSDTNFCKFDSITYTAANYDAASTTGFSWDFGDGVKTPFGATYNTYTHTYVQSGNYKPSLILMDALGCKDTIKQNQVNFHVYGPKAAFTNPAGTCLNGTINFADQSTADSLHPIATWTWNYGDGQTQSYTGGPFSHTYIAAATYDVVLSVFDTYGCRDTILKPAAVIITSPKVKFSLSDSILCTKTTENFLDSSTGLSLKFKWDFGDGGTSTIKSPTHSYAAPGIYTVKSLITDRFGCQDSVTKINAVTISNPKASFILNDTFGICPPLLIQPQNTSVNYKSLTWNFDDGNTSVFDNPVHYYTNGGNYTLKLVVQGYGQCFDSASKSIILKGPGGSFTYDPLAACKNATVNFTATVKNTSKIVWDFNDGNTVTTNDTALTHKYQSSGKYLPKLVLYDQSGCIVSKVNTDTITISDVAAGIKSLLKPTCDSSLVLFNDSSQVYFDTINSYSWDFGDNTTSIASSPSHYYSQNGTYNVTLSVVTANGCTSTITVPEQIHINKSPVLNMSAADSTCLSSPLSFTVTDNGADTAIGSWAWNFGNGDVSAIQNPTYTYPAAGQYTVSVNATNLSGCSDTVSKTVYIQAAPPVDAGLSTVICAGSSANLQASGAYSYTWDAQPSLSCTNCAQPVANPDSTITYYVTGASSLGCTAKDSVQVVVQQQVKLVSITSDSLCAGSTVQLQVSGADNYTWSPSTGLSDPSVGNPIASPSTTTTYTVTGTDSNNCFSDMATVTVNVFPIPVFNIIDSVVNLNVGSGDTLHTSNSADIISWQWSPGIALSCYSCAQPYAAPKNTITYTAQVFNAGGCSATDQVTVKVLCSGANIFIPNTFTPNNDGMNDRFFIRGTGLFSVKSMRIFNRWGQIVFEKLNLDANNFSNGWDGTYNGKAVPSDVYVYVMEVICDNSSIFTYKGNVTLLR